MQSKKEFLLVACLFLLISTVTVRSASALSFNDIIVKPQSLIIRVTEKLEYVFAFTSVGKVQVLEKQAERRLTEAKNSAQAGDIVEIESAVKAYENLKNQQAPILDEVDQDVIDEVKTKTINQQESLLDVVDFSPGSAGAVATTNKNVVETVKKTIEYKEGTMAGEAFEDRATIMYAPGTGPGGEGGGVKIEGGELHTWAPGTSEGGEGGVTYEGGAMHVWAPGTSEGGSGGNVVVEQQK